MKHRVNKQTIKDKLIRNCFEPSMFSKLKFRQKNNISLTIERYKAIISNNELSSKVQTGMNLSEGLAQQYLLFFPNKAFFVGLVLK